MLVHVQNIRVDKVHFLENLYTTLFVVIIVEKQIRLVMAWPTKEAVLFLTVEAVGWQHQGVQQKLLRIRVATALLSLAVLHAVPVTIFQVYAGSGQIASKVAAKVAENVRLRSVEITFVILQSLPKIAHSIVAGRLILYVTSVLQNALQSAVLNLPVVWTTAAVVQCLFVVRHFKFYTFWPSDSCCFNFAVDVIVNFPYTDRPALAACVLPRCIL